MNNPYRVIKQLAFVTGFCIVSCTTALAQQSLFVFLQSENWQPFYVQIEDKVYSSSSVGHLVIAGLPDKPFNVEIGFPHVTRPQRFSIPLSNKDHGYQLVKSGSQGWALYDWQTEETIKPLKEEGNAALLYGERKNNDAFATLMSSVVNDSAVLYTSVVKKEKPQVPSVAATDPATTQPTVDTVLVEKKAAQETVIHDTAKAAMVDTPLRDSAVAISTYDPQERPLHEKPKTVVKIQQQTKDGETKMVFVDSADASVVTVYINDTVAAAENAISDVAKTQPDSGKAIAVSPVNAAQPAAVDTATIVLESAQIKKTDVAPAADSQVVKAEQPKVDAVAQKDTVVVKDEKPATPVEQVDAVKKDTPVVVKPEPAKPAETGTKLVMINSDCDKLASENDVDKLRVKLIAENDMQKKLALANKTFKTMCLYARQIRALSELFPTDENKYKFLEMAYPFAADTANFKGLYELLTDEMYVTKFKKLVRLQ